MRRLTIFRAFTAAVTAATTLWWARPAHGEAVFVGACTMTANVAFSSPVGIVPTPGTHGLGGGGTCVVNGQTASMTLSGGGFTANPFTGFGCLAGVAHGQVRVSIPVSGFPNPVVDLVIVNEGGTVHVAAYALLTRFEGVAELVQAPARSAACVTNGGISSTTWTGVLVFQDPDPPPVGP